MQLHSSHQTLGSSGGRGSLVALGLALAALLAPSALTASATAQADFPVTVIDDEGTEVTIEAEPQRIISLSPANTEIVFALDSGTRLVGGSAYDLYPPEAAELPDVVTFNAGVVMEQVVALEPDVIFAAGNFFTPPADIARLRTLGYPVVVVYAEDIPAVLADIELIGEVIGRADAAAAITAEMTSQFEAITSATSGVERPRTYYELDWFEGTSFAAAPDSFVADMVELAGGAPITTGDAAVFQMPIERLIEADPEVIVLGDAMFGHCPESVAARSGWGDLSAVRDGAVRPVDGELVTLPGPRLPQGLAALTRAIHPEIALPGFAADRAICEAA